MKQTLFQYSILWHPTEKQMKEDGLKSTVLVEVTTILAKDIHSAQMIAAMNIPFDYKNQIDQVEIACRPF